MKITDIKQQVKRQGRYSIFVDDKYSFSLSEGELAGSNIRIGKEYTEEDFEQLKQTAVLDKARMRVLDLLARRPRSEWEIKDYLKRKDYGSSTIEEVVNSLSEYGYIDDDKFARAWVDNRRLLKSVSKRKLWTELKQKHIADDVIKIVLEDDATDERQVIRDLVSKKRQQTRYQDDTKLMQYLSRQGFKYDDIKAEMSSDN